MAKFFDPKRDPLEKYGTTGTSGAEVSDLRPEQAYDTDMRRIDEDERVSAESVNNDQDRISKFIRAAKTAGKFRQEASIDEPTLRGKVPRRRASIQGVELPTRGDKGGRAGSTTYSQIPQKRSGKPYNWLDGFS